MSGAAMSVGFSPRIRLAWMEETVALVAAGNERAAVNGALEDLLADTLAVGSHTRRNSRAKTIIVLLKIWLDGPKDIAGLRQAGLGLIETLPGADRVAVHWGMTQAAYPFWGAVAAQVGRLLRLQDMATANQIQRRMREMCGDRETVAVGTQRVLRSFVDWGVLVDTARSGVYAPGARVDVGCPSLAAWLVEALLTSGVGRASAAHLASHPSLFPFGIAPMGAREIVAESPRLGLVRHGFSDDLVMLAAS